MTQQDIDQLKANQALAILDTIDDSLQAGGTITFGRVDGQWFARMGSELFHGVSLRDALAQLAQTMVQ